MRYYIGNCINNPFERIELLVEVTERAKTITKKTFLAGVYLDDKIKKNIKDYPDDFEFFSYKGIYFFTHSGIEYFYK
jgi:hypothetical protein